MELTEKQIQDLNKYSLVLNSLNMEDGVSWHYQCFDSEFERLYGPIHDGKQTDDLSFLPGSIEELFEEIKNNFDTENFYNEFYDNENGTLSFTIYANKKEIDIMYEYFQVETEETDMEKNFSDFESVTPIFLDTPFDNLKNLMKPEFVESLKEVYGDKCVCTYDGSGDSGWVQDQVDSDKGSKGMNQDLENICYELLEVYFAGLGNK